ncbi:hypothetical protein NL676_036887 [Syzygium grande]|nr:hypothetical protein NL676_036887 [Syzygium grande]
MSRQVQRKGRRNWMQGIKVPSPRLPYKKEGGPPPFFPREKQHLARPQETLEEGDPGHCGVVRALYEALRTRDVGTVHRIVAPDLEWWFHGPPTHQFLMRLLTGAPGSTSDGSFEFVPDSVTSVGSIVLAEGCDQDRSIYWAHAWTIADGIITQVREYFNTSLTVTRLGGACSSSSSSPPPPSALGSEIAAAPGSQHCPSIWESSLSNRVGKSVPGLVLAI